MVQVLPKVRSFGEEIGGALGKGAGLGFAEAMQSREEKKKLEEENKAILRETGIDLSGVSDPEARKAAFVQKLKEQAPQKPLNELQKSQKNLADQKTDFYDRKMKWLDNVGKQRNQEESQEDILNIPGITKLPDEDEEPTQRPRDKKTTTQKQPTSPIENKPPHTAEDIQNAAVFDPTTARIWQQQNDAWEKKKQHLEETTQKNKIARSKEVTESFKENESFINKTYDQYEDSQRKEAILDRMDKLDESDELSDSGMINLMESLGIKPTWLKNPANEEYTKLALDLLGGGSLQSDYGSRVLQSEFKVSMQRIPDLLQTKEGRMQIKENLRAMTLPSKLKQERLQYYLDKADRTGEPLPHNLRGKILNDIKPQLEESYDKFKQRNGRYKVAKGTNPDNNAIEKYFYLADKDDEKSFKMMKEDGYVVD